MNPSLTVRLQTSSPVLKGLAVLAGTGLLTLSSYIQVPMLPVPMTLQTLAVTLIGALYGWRLGTAAIVAWLMEAALGLPVLAGGAAGLPYFLGPTGGYLLAFPLAGALTGWLVERGWNRLLPVFVAMLLANVLCLAVGGAWLSVLIGPEKAFLAGVAPFALGAVVKSGLGAAIFKALAR